METKNTQNCNVKKHAKIQREIDQLDIQITAVKNEIHTLENEEKLESYKKNLLEVRKDKLKSDFEYYEKYSEKMDMKMTEKQTAYLKFSITNEYYEKLLEIHRKQQIQPENFCSSEEIPLCEVNSCFRKQMNNMEEQVAKLAATIEINSATIKNLLKNLNM